MQPPSVKLQASNHFAIWLNEQNTSLGFTSYDSSFLYLVGVNNEGSINISYRKFGRTMGLTYRNDTIYLASDGYIYELENDGYTGENADACFVPRRVSMVGDVDLHELSFVGDDLYFACTRYSCVGKLDKQKSFTSVFKPDFIADFVPEDRCHLNGLAVKDGKLSAVSICSRSDSLEGWRGNRQHGGAIIDAKSSTVIVNNSSMPHSPRYHQNELWYLDSGRGFLCGPDRKYFIPGFARGLVFVGEYAVVTVSLPREGIFKGLELQDNIQARGGEAWCGILAVNLKTGGIDHWLRIEGETRELFDVVALPNIRCPSLLSPSDPVLANRITIAR